MTDSINALTVTLEKDIRNDDVQSLLNAIRQLRGVLTVTEHVADIDSHVANERARHELGKKLFDMVYGAACGGRT